jgi:hypothetical protein
MMPEDGDIRNENTLEISQASSDPDLYLPAAGGRGPVAEPR